MGIINGFVELCNTVGGFLWGPWTQIFLIAVGIYLTIGTKFYQVRKFGYIMKNTVGTIFQKREDSKVGLTEVQAVMGALAGTIGMGNISGTASAIAIGGPGAVFWMWIFAFFGMMIKTSEVTLAVHYREVSPDGKEIHGGPMYYMKKALNSKLLAVIFSFGLFFNALLMASTMQTHTIVEAAGASYGFNPYVVAVVVVGLAALAILGGLKSIGKVCETFVPVMTVIWILAALYILATNFTQIPRVFSSIFLEAFAPTPAAGGFVGASVAMAIQQGASRGTGSNDAGLGVAPCIHATAEVDHPFKQGLWGTAEVFIDTIIVCTMTAFIILAPVGADGVPTWASGESGVALTLLGMQQSMPAFMADLIVNICVAAFCFSTVLVFYVYYETASINLFGKKSFKYIKWLYFIFPIAFAGYTNVNALWGGFANVATGLCLLPNLIALVLLSGSFFGLVKDYDGERKYLTAITDKSHQYIKTHPAYLATIRSDVK